MAGDGLSPAAATAAGMPTPASGPGTPLPERTKLVLVSMSGDESIVCPLNWVKLDRTCFLTAGVSQGNPHQRRTRRPWCSGSAHGSFPSGEGKGERTRAQPALPPWSRAFLRHSILQVWTPKRSEWQQRGRRRLVQRRKRSLSIYFDCFRYVCNVH